jgi:DNA-binding MarR family transcriptional regulator
VAQAFRALRHALDDALRDLNLTTPQWGTLACISESEGISGADIARIHHLTPQTTHTILHNLEVRDLIVRERHPLNGTVLCARLTDAGRERLQEGMLRVEAVQERMVAGLSAADRDSLMDLLGRCAHNLHVEDEAYTADDCVD